MFPRNRPLEEAGRFARRRKPQFFLSDPGDPEITQLRRASCKPHSLFYHAGRSAFTPVYAAGSTAAAIGMADYSDFGSPCEDWLSLTRDNDIVPPVPLLQTREQSRAFRAAGNGARYRASKEALSKLGDLDVSIETVSILCRDFQEIGARIYWPSPSASSRETKTASIQDGDSCKVLLYFHGGGFLSGSLSTEDALCVQLANHGNIVVISVNYRHTPEWTYPTPFDDAWAARCQILHEPQTLGLPPNVVLYVAGISSGANLAASLTVRERIVS